MDNICKRLVLIALGGLTIGGVSSSIVLADTKPVETSATDENDSYRINVIATDGAYEKIVGYSRRLKFGEENGQWTGVASQSPDSDFATDHTFNKASFGGTEYYFQSLTINKSAMTSSKKVTVQSFDYDGNWISDQKSWARTGSSGATGDSYISSSAYITDGTTNCILIGEYSEAPWLNWSTNSSWGLSGCYFKAKKFDKITGQCIGSEMLKTGDTPAAAPTHEGYEFAGWYVDSDCTIPYTQINNDVYLYAKYNALKYTLEFDANGGSGDQESMTAELGNSLELPDCTFDVPSQFYDFGGWIDPDDNILQPGDAVTYSVAGTYTYKAKWDRLAATVTVNSGSPIQLTWDDANNQFKVENLNLASGDLIELYLDGDSVTWNDGASTNLLNHRIKKPGSNIGLYFKIESGAIVGYASGSETGYSRQFVVNNVFVNTDIDKGKSPWEYYKLNLSLNSGDQIKLSHNYGAIYNVVNLEKHTEVDTYFVLTSGAIVCSYTGVYDLYLKSYDGGDHYDSVYIEFCGETKATIYAQYFNNTLASICNPQGGTDLTTLENAWSQTPNTNLAAKYSALNDIAKGYFSNTYTPETGSDLEECLRQYDFIVTKYKVGGLSTKINNFMSRTEVQPKPVGPEPINPNSKNNGFAILISVIGAATLLSTGVFVASKVSKKKKHK